MVDEFMTNQEIEKRFQFDLEMGVFKCLHPDSHSKQIVFTNIRERDKSRFKLVKVLEKIGYMKDSINMPSRNIVLIVVNIDTKDFTANKGYLYDFLNYNDIPNYISKYRLKPEESCNDLDD